VGGLGHVATFTDPLTECQSCHKRFRADHLQEAVAERRRAWTAPRTSPWPRSLPELRHPKGQWTEPRDFNMMLRTTSARSRTRTGLHYLRPETAQGIFVNFKNVMTSSRKKPPFGIARHGQVLPQRDHPGNFIFRTREFEQMEMEFFVTPGTDEEWHQYWIDERTRWYIDLGINPENLRHYEHPKEKLSHYSKRTVDIEYKFGFQGSEWGELEGIANRTDFDLSDALQALRRRPELLQPGHRREVRAVRHRAGRRPDPLPDDLPRRRLRRGRGPNTKGGVDKRTVLRLDPRLAPVKAAVLPLSKNA
jgi:glycyl-tRNA synthetase